MQGKAEKLAGLLLLAGALAWAAWLMAPTLEGPFRRGYLGQNGARYSLMARNYLRFDPWESHYLPLVNPAGASAPNPYAHHPPGVPLTLALIFERFGESERAARLFPFGCTLAVVVVLYLLGKRLAGGPLGGGFCALLFAGLPMTAHYGAHVDVQGSPLLLSMLAAALFHEQWIEKGSRWRQLLALAALAAGMFYDWFALYLCILFPLRRWAAERGKGVTFGAALRASWSFFALGGILFAGLVLWLAAAPRPLMGATLFEALAVRTFDPWLLLEGELTAADLRDRLVLYAIPAFCLLNPWPWWVLAGFGSVIGKYKNTAPYLLPGLLHLVLFPLGGTLFHDYWTFLLAPWFALAGAASLAWFAKKPLRSRAAACSLRLGIGLVLAGTLWIGADHAQERLDLEEDIASYRLGRAIAAAVPPGGASAVNAPINPAIPGEPGRFLLTSPLLAYYADRYLFGGIDTLEELEALRRAREEVRYFLYLEPPGGTEDPALLERLFKGGDLGLPVPGGRLFALD